MSLLASLRTSLVCGLTILAGAGVATVAAAATPFVDSLPSPGPAGSPLTSSEARAGDSLPHATRVLVRKSERRMYLLRGGEVLRTYRVALGLNLGNPCVALHPILSQLFALRHHAAHFLGRVPVAHGLLPEDNRAMASAIRCRWFLVPSG